MIRTFKHYSDDAHGWLAVPYTLLVTLGLDDKVSAYSYQSKTGKTVYLEEDRDAGLFLEEFHKRGFKCTVTNVHHNGRSRIRNLNDYMKGVNEIV